ncbi:MAG TPA: hypothetical protein VG187_18500 [Mycobacterium sp.]|nr:hypothetical protein [Mycobacterium sp.]
MGDEQISARRAIQKAVEARYVAASVTQYSSHGIFQDNARAEQQIVPQIVRCGS